MFNYYRWQKITADQQSTTTLHKNILPITPHPQYAQRTPSRFHQHLRQEITSQTLSTKHTHPPIPKQPPSPSNPQQITPFHLQYSQSNTQLTFCFRGDVHWIQTNYNGGFPSFMHGYEGIIGEQSDLHRIGLNCEVGSGKQISSKVRVVKQLPAGVATLGIDHNHLPQKIKLDLIHSLQGLTPVGSAILQLHLPHCVEEMLILNVALLYACDGNDLFELLELVVCFEESVASDHEVEDASEGPDVHWFGVGVAAEEQFWGAVEEGADHVGHGFGSVQFLGHAAVYDSDVVVEGVDVCGVWLGEEVCFFGGEHDVGWFQISVDHLTTMKFLNPPQNLFENLLYRELFLTPYHPIQISCQPLHHHYWLILPQKRLDHLHQVRPTQNLEDVALADEANGQSNFALCFEFFDCHYFLGLLVAGLVDCPIGALLRLLQDHVLLAERLALHQTDQQIQHQQSYIIIHPTIKYNPFPSQTTPLLILLPHLQLLLHLISLTTMGKIHQDRSTHKLDQHSGHLHVSSDDMKSLASFMKKLREDFQGKSSKTILPKIHTILKQNKRKIYFDFTKIKERLRICKQCDKWNSIRSMIQCSKCEDNYHQACLSQQVQGTFVCTQCRKGSGKLPKCLKCKKVVSAQENKKCSKCLLTYHKQCWKNTKEFCSKCCKLECQIKNSTEQKAYELYKANIGKEDSVTTFRSQLFNFERFIRNERELKKYTTSLMEAIKEKGMNYSQHLIDLDDFQSILSENSMDFGINFMTSEECRAYQEYKKMPIGPYVLKTIKNKGFDVIADREIPERTLICEYVGEVVTLRECIELQERKKNDSLMELQAGKNSEETLIIRPDKFTNMGRFINGVKKESKQENIESMKLLHRGKPVVLLVAKRRIRRGESLCYDYNAGGIVAEYDTTHFV